LTKCEDTHSVDILIMLLHVTLTNQWHNVAVTYISLKYYKTNVVC